MRPIDPVLSLAMSLDSNPGVFALLLGSGVSRSARIPTGWEVVVDLIRKVAALEGESAEPSPADWYLSRFGVAPTYSALLETLAKTPAERMGLLRGYFEPTESERTEGAKLPTAAHHAIAKLMNDGVVRVILTTNFDSLLEQAAEAVGFHPLVLASPDSIDGMPSLAHAEKLILKLHGDYRDTRIKNTPVELDSYHRNTNLLLHRIFDEFGLIVCGWSADWDSALRTALERCKTHRYSTYWVHRGALSPAAQALVELRQATLIQSPGADVFFPALVERIDALRSLSRPHPLSVQVAVETTKRYLEDEERFRIRLHDSVHEIVDELIERTNDDRFPASDRSGVEAAAVAARFQEYEAAVEMALAVVITGSRWGSALSARLWVDAIERAANGHEVTAGITALLNLRRYPALLLLYGAGLAALAGGHYDTVNTLLFGARIRSLNEETPTTVELNGLTVVNNDMAKLLPGLERRHTPVSDHLFDVLREPLRYVIPDGERYAELFDRFECFIALAYIDSGKRGGRWAPFGRFVWRESRGDRSEWTKMVREFESAKSQWAPVAGGFMEGDVARVEKAIASFGEFMSSPSIQGMRW